MAEISTQKRIWGWYFFDWASQPYHTLLVTFIFGPYFASIAVEFFMAGGLDKAAADARTQSAWAWTQTIAGMIIGFGAPLIGALADSTGRRIPWIYAFSAMYVLGSVALWFAYPDGSTLWWTLIAFGFGLIGAEYALIFVNSQLPSLGTDEEIGSISGSAFAFGYAGGFLALILMLCLFAEQGDGKTLIGIDPVFGLSADEREGTRMVGPFTALWFAIFMIPYFRWVHDDPNRPAKTSFSSAMSMLGDLVKSLLHRLSLSAYLGSSMFYRDALNGLYSFGGVYATLVLDWQVIQIGVFGIVALISSVVFSWAGGQVDRRIGPKPVIIGAIWVLIAVSTLIICMSRTQILGIPLPEGSTLPDTLFFVCGALIGGMGGVLQSSSRSLMVRHSDPASPTEYFGLYGLSGRATSFVAPLLIGIVTTATGNTQLGYAPIILLFLIGLVLLLWVKSDGEKQPG